jgi:hypothetical protein
MIYNMPNIPNRPMPYPPEVMKRLIDRAKRMNSPGMAGALGQGNGQARAAGGQQGGFRGSNAANLVSNNQRLMNTNANLNLPAWMQSFQKQVGQQAAPPPVNMYSPMVPPGAQYQPMIPPGAQYQPMRPSQVWS